MRCIVYILILSAVFACSSQGKLQEMEPFQSEKVLVAEKVLMPDAISPCFMMLKGQNLFLIDVKTIPCCINTLYRIWNVLIKVVLKGRRKMSSRLFQCFAELHLTNFIFEDLLRPG